MKAPVKAMSRSAIVAELATATELKTSVVKKVLAGLTQVATKEVKKYGKFTIPDLVTIKTRTKPARKATKRMVIGKMVTVKAKPATKIVKGFCAPALKRSI